MNPILNNTTASNQHQVLVLGAGTFGTCLAQHLAEKGYSVLVHSNSQDIVHSITEKHRNPKYLSQVTLSPRVSATAELSTIDLSSVESVVVAVPTQFIRNELTLLQRTLKTLFDSNKVLICAAKGLEIETHKLPGDIITEIFGDVIGKRTVFLSGPSFASEIADRQPTCVTAASLDSSHCQKAQEIFHAAHFRVYTSKDPIGLQVCGALKNVIALAAGACAGLGFQMNSRAALITRGLAEITRVGVSLGASPLTFNGLSGVGDLFLSCTSEKSRNFSVGFRLGKGEKLGQILKNLGSVAEGITTTKAAFFLAKNLNLDTPITNEVYHVLYEQKPIAKAVFDLITRDAKPELEL